MDDVLSDGSRGPTFLGHDPYLAGADSVPPCEPTAVINPRVPPTPLGFHLRIARRHHVH
ncbi:hypothetical protein [Streptomyces sp. A244]|uniref:hypothetical protein n=1 Tax=Streptomyces TaxID=1883 RepID=UPI0015E71073|nr:hypothetical protein [Streptomyces sp. A244]